MERIEPTIGPVRGRAPPALRPVDLAPRPPGLGPEPAHAPRPQAGPTAVAVASRRVNQRRVGVAALVLFLAWAAGLYFALDASLGAQLPAAELGYRVGYRVGVALLCAGAATLVVLGASLFSRRVWGWGGVLARLVLLMGLFYFFSAPASQALQSNL